MLMTVDSRVIQVSLELGIADVEALNQAIGQPIEVKASADHSPKTKHGAHPVYQLEKLTKLRGKAVKSSGDAQPVRGIVSKVHYAKHGEPNGVILDSAHSSTHVPTA